MGDTSIAKDKYELRPWILRKLEEMSFESPEMLVNYVLLLISNEKTIAEIASELDELLGEEESAVFSKELEIEMNKRIKKRKQTGNSDSKYTIAASVPSSASASRSEQQHQQQKFAPSTSLATKNANIGNDREFNNSEKRQRVAPPPATFYPPQIPTAPVSSARNLLNQMNLMAQAQGFASVDEMMMAQMVQFPAAGASFPPPGPFVGGRGFGGRGDSAQFHHGYSGRGGRGFDATGRGRGTFDSGRGRGRGRGFDAGRGRGRDAGRGRGRESGRGRGFIDEGSMSYVRIDANGGLPSSR